MDTNGARAYTPPNEQEPSPTEALQRLQQQIAELREYLAHFVSAKVDGIVLSVRQMVMWGVLGVAGLLCLAGLVITAVVLLLDGAATGIALLLGGRLWLGQMIVGGVVLALLTFGMILGMRTWQRRWHQQKVQQYDERQLQQRVTFGHSVADRATDNAALRNEQ
jgi:membrane protein implicated in regulation of membrane protease activity